MKKKYSTLPESMKNMEMYGFNWMEFVVSVPSPLYIITSYKSNGQPNACMQSWTTFTGGKNGYFAIVSAVSKYGHLYQTLHETGEAVINFMSADLYDKCMSTCKNNGFETDEIKTAGLTSVKAEMVNAPLIDELPMALECKVKSFENGILIGEIVNVSADESVITDGKIDPKKLKPIAFDPCNNAYLAMGDKVGDAFNIGMKLK